MSNFRFDNTQEFQLDKAKKGLFLWILHAQSIPPHIGISLDGFYYSLKYNGKDEGLEIAKLVHLINRKKIKTILVELLDFSIDQRLISGVFSKFEQAKGSELSCLKPIHNLLLPPEESLILAELLQKIAAREQIGSVFTLHLSENRQEIPRYSRVEIAERLQKLHDSKRKKHIPESH